ncbi:MAG: type II secretion system protein, partial [Victivallales bacterium]|nr:type II secretion system protein [Victivallales bacterium]
MQQRRHFTLIELLTVIAIMGVLAAILMPALSKARRKAHLTSCMNQLRQIAGLGFAMYMGDNGDRLPLWPSNLFPSYLPDKRT